jgi:hypothetical protein
MLGRLVICFLAVGGCLGMLMCASNIANSKPEPDYSNPELVNEYIFLPCDAMAQSYEFMYGRFQQTELEYDACVEQSKTSVLLYPSLMCIWINQDMLFRFEHMMSIQKAYRLMCTEETGIRKEPEYEITY